MVFLASLLAAGLLGQQHPDFERLAAALALRIDGVYLVAAHSEATPRGRQGIIERYCRVGSYESSEAWYPQSLCSFDAGQCVHGTKGCVEDIGKILEYIAAVPPAQALKYDGVRLVAWTLGNKAPRSWHALAVSKPEPGSVRPGFLRAFGLDGDLWFSETWRQYTVTDCTHSAWLLQRDNPDSVRARQVRMVCDSETLVLNQLTYGAWTRKDVVSTSLEVGSRALFCGVQCVADFHGKSWPCRLTISGDMPKAVARDYQIIDVGRLAAGQLEALPQVDAKPWGYPDVIAPEKTRNGLLEAAMSHGGPVRSLTPRPDGAKWVGYGAIILGLVGVGLFWRLRWRQS